MKKQMLINAVHPEQKRMAIVEDGKLVEFNIQMAVREPITGNVYKGIVMKVERGLQAAFVNYAEGGGFSCPCARELQLLSRNPTAATAAVTLRPGQEILVRSPRGQRAQGAP
jgi:ribonuclease E